MSDLHFPRLNLAVYQTYIIPNRWALFSDSAMIECSIHGRLRTMIVSLYGEHGLVAIKRCTGVAWDEIDHRLFSWFEARPSYFGWLLEMRALEEVAA